MRRWILLSLAILGLLVAGAGVAVYLKARERPKGELDTQLKDATGGVIQLSTGESFESDVIVWTAGVKANPKLVQAFVEALREATAFVNDKPAEAAKIYVASEKSKSSEAEILAIMKQDGIKYTLTPSGFVKVATFMGKIGMIKKLPASWKDYAFEHLHALPGS